MSTKVKTVKTVKVKKPSRKGILWLADVLIHNKEKYDQSTFGSSEGEPCGTVCCLAGFAYAGEIGFRKFNKLTKDLRNYESICKNSRRAGASLLGVSQEEGTYYIPEIFNYVSYWPEDLREEYYANGPKGRVVTALKALQRLHSDGTIDKDPKVVITIIPQLTALLKKKAKV